MPIWTESQSEQESDATGTGYSLRSVELSVFRKIGKTRETLLDITADGVIDESEKPELEAVMRNLEEIEEIAQSMKLWIKKNL